MTKRHLLHRFPKLETQRIFPTEAFKRAKRNTKLGITLNIMIRTPNDPWISRPLIGGVMTYLADAWNLASPVGEIALIAGTTTAGLRYLFTRKTLEKNYKNEILREAISNSNSKENSAPKPLSSLCGIEGYVLRPRA